MTWGWSKFGEYAVEACKFLTGMKGDYAPHTSKESPMPDTGPQVAASGMAYLDYTEYPPDMAEFSPKAAQASIEDRVNNASAADENVGGGQG